MGTHEFGKFRPLRVHMIVRPKLFPNGVGRTWSLIKTWIKLDQADFTDWISFLRSNSMGRKPALIMRLSMLTPKAFHQHEKTEKTMIWWWMFDDELFLWYGWQAKGIQPYFQPEPLSEILTITNLWHPEQDLNLHRTLVQVSLNKVQHSQSHSKLTLKISGLSSWPTLLMRNFPK